MTGTSCRTLFNALENGGPAGLIYGYLFVWCGVILQALVMAEMASMYVFDTAMPMISFSFLLSLLCYDMNRIRISFRRHPQKSAFGRGAGDDPSFRRQKYASSRGRRGMILALLCMSARALWSQEWRSQLASGKCSPLEFC